MFFSRKKLRGPVLNSQCLINGISEPPKPKRTFKEWLSDTTLDIIRAIVNGCFYFAVYAFFTVVAIGYIIYYIALLLIERDFTQWYLGTGKYARRD